MVLLRNFVILGFRESGVYRVFLCKIILGGWGKEFLNLGTLSFLLVIMFFESEMLLGAVSLF